MSKDVTILAPVVSRATIQWRTTQPYEAAVLVRPGATLRLENINVRHSSPSVANNYSVFCQEGTLEAASCDISSASGSGIGIEGGTALISDCKIRDCKGSGAVVAGALLDSDTQELDSTSTKVCFSHSTMCTLSTPYCLTGPIFCCKLGLQHVLQVQQPLK